MVVLQWVNLVFSCSSGKKTSPVQRRTICNYNWKGRPDLYIWWQNGCCWRISYSQVFILLLWIRFIQSLNTHYIQELVNLKRIWYFRAEQREGQRRKENWLKSWIPVNDIYLLLFFFPNKPLFTVYLFIVLDEKGRQYEELIVVSKMGMFGDSNSSKRHWNEQRRGFSFFFQQGKCTSSALSE